MLDQKLEHELKYQTSRLKFSSWENVVGIGHFYKCVHTLKKLHSSLSHFMASYSFSHLKENKKLDKNIHGLATTQELQLAF